MNMEHVFSNPLPKKKVEDPLAEVPVSEVDIAREERRVLASSNEVMEQARDLVQKKEAADGMVSGKEKDDEMNSIRMGMSATKNLAEQQIALATDEEEKERIRKAIKLMENNEIL